LRKIHNCIFAALIFKNFQKNQKLVLRIRLAFPIRFLRFTDRRNLQKQDPFQKVGSDHLGGNIMGQKV